MTGHNAYRGRLAIPYITRAGVVSLKFRDLTGTANTKYLHLPGQQPRLYNASILLDHPTVAIVEGELDALVMTHAVGVPAVAVSGTDTWLAHMPRCFADCDRVYVVCDNDIGKPDPKTGKPTNPGQRLAKKIAEDLRGKSLVIVPPEGQDITDWFLSVGQSGVLEQMGLRAPLMQPYEGQA